jgi:hypothetical protein
VELASNENARAAAVRVGYTPAQWDRIAQELRPESKHQVLLHSSAWAVLMTSS